MRTWVMAGIALADSTGTALAQDAAAGEQVFSSYEGFNYSPVNKSSGIVWSTEAFDKYIRAPMQEMPGTRMAFVGIKNDKDITDLWAYLKEFGPDGAKK